MIFPRVMHYIDAGSLVLVHGKSGDKFVVSMMSYAGIDENGVQLYVVDGDRSFTLEDHELEELTEDVA